MPRLVSALYHDFYPFNEMGLFDICISTQNPEHLQKGDVLVIWGGQDIHPSYYGKKASPQSQAYPMPSRRDQTEWALIQRAKELNLLIIGVCRGAQMLCAAAGGYLMQHITGHAGPHHTIATNDGRSFVVNSLHHQMMVPDNTEHELLAVSSTLRSKEYWDEHKKVDHNQEPELVWFPKIRGFAIQWHPEMMFPDAPATQYLKELLQDKL